jgi:predicted PurR-regulated permease PerM
MERVMFKHGLDRRAASYTWTVLFILSLLGVLYLIRETLFVFALALLFSYLLRPLVYFLDRRLPGRSRAPALAIVYLALVGLLIAVGIAVGSRVVLEADALSRSIPELLSKLEKPAALIASPSLPTFKDAVISTLQQQLVEHSRDLLSLLPNIALGFLSHAGSLIYIVLVPILGFFLLKDGPEFRISILAMLADGTRRDEIKEIAADVNLLLAQYMRALVLLASASFVAYGLFFFLVGVPYGILLAAIAFFLEFIPIVGPLAGAVAILMVAGLSGFGHLLWILLFLAVFRIFQDYVLSPHLMSKGAKLQPVMVILGVLAGGQIAGIPGIFLSVPVLAIIRIIYLQLKKKLIASKVDAPGTGSI